MANVNVYLCPKCEVEVELLHKKKHKYRCPQCKGIFTEKRLKVIMLEYPAMNGEWQDEPKQGTVPVVVPVGSPFAGAYRKWLTAHPRRMGFQIEMFNLLYKFHNRKLRIKDYWEEITTQIITLLAKDDTESRRDLARRLHQLPTLAQEFFHYLLVITTVAKAQKFPIEEVLHSATEDVRLIDQLRAIDALRPQDAVLKRFPTLKDLQNFQKVCNEVAIPRDLPHLSVSEDGPFGLQSEQYFLGFMGNLIASHIDYLDRQWVEKRFNLNIRDYKMGD